MWSSLHAFKRCLVQTSKGSLTNKSSIVHTQKMVTSSSKICSSNLHHNQPSSTTIQNQKCKINSQLLALSNDFLSTSTGVCLNQTRSYRAALRPRLWCQGCYYVWRHGRKYVECSDHPRHKQMKKLPTKKIWKEDYSRQNAREVAKAMDLYRTEPRQWFRNTNQISLSHNWLAGRLGKDL